MWKETPVFSIANQRFNVIILAAGLGTRLRPETEFIPKALVELGGLRAIDYTIRKYEYIADRVIVASGYGGDLLENYCRGRYDSLSLHFSREEVSELLGPGTSLRYALDHASSRIGTLVTFCDYLVEDPFPVDADCLGLCRPVDEEAVLDGYKTVARIRDGVVTGLAPNPAPREEREHGFTGIAVFRNTTVLKSIVYTAAASKSRGEDIDYAMEIVNPYVARVRTVPCPLSRLFEFGTEETLRRTKGYLNGHRRPARQPV